MPLTHLGKAHAKTEKAFKTFLSTKTTQQATTGGHAELREKDGDHPACKCPDYSKRISQMGHPVEARCEMRGGGQTCDAAHHDSVTTGARGTSAIRPHLQCADEQLRNTSMIGLDEAQKGKRTYRLPAKAYTERGQRTAALMFAAF